MRDTPLVRFIDHGLLIYALFFATVMMGLGDFLTSKQWTYLLSIPGGRWTWGAMFGAAAITVFYGLRQHRHGIIALGEAMMGSWCFAIVLFYVIAPFYESSLLTLGFVPWTGMGTLMFAWAAMHRNEKPW